MTDIREWLEQASEPCGNDACIGYDAREVIVALLDEVERLTEDIDTLHRECARLYEIEDEHRKCPL